MATLSQVYSNLGIGAFVTTVCYLGFGAAVRFECNKFRWDRIAALSYFTIQGFRSSNGIMHGHVTSFVLYS